MTREQFLNLTVGDGLVYRGITGTVTAVNDVVIRGYKSRQIEFVYFQDGKRYYFYPWIFLYCYEEIHNSIILNDCRAFDIFGEQQ